MIEFSVWIVPLVALLGWGAYRDSKRKNSDPLLLVLVPLAAIAFCWQLISLDELLGTPETWGDPVSPTILAGKVAVAFFVPVCGLLLLCVRYLPIDLLRFKPVKLTWGTCLWTVATAVTVTGIKTAIFVSLALQEMEILKNLNQP